MNGSSLSTHRFCSTLTRFPALRLCVALLGAAGGLLVFFSLLIVPALAAAGDPPLVLDRVFAEGYPTSSLAWGDVDGDGDLDLAMGNAGIYGASNHVFLSDGGDLATTPSWSSDESDLTQSLAWGDVDGDGDLDLAAGNGCSLFAPTCHPNRIYRNDTTGGTPVLTLAWTAPVTEATNSLAWGDMDGDGDLDLAVGSGCSGSRETYTCLPDRLYRNDSTGGTIAMTQVWTSTLISSTQSVAWGDLDGDGDLDLVVGNGDGQREINEANVAWRNDGPSGNAQQMTQIWTSTEARSTLSVALADYDRDGYPDLAVGNSIIGSSQPNQIYRNTGGALPAGATWTSTESDFTYDVSWGDYDADGYLDLAVANGLSADTRLYHNDAGTIGTTATWSSSESSNYARAVAWGDYDGDGMLDLAVGTSGTFSRLYRNNGGALGGVAAWSIYEQLFPDGVAWGDVDGDDDLDLAFGNRHVRTTGPQNAATLFENTFGMPAYTPIFTSTETDAAQAVAWGDVDGDGDLDLAIGNGDDQSDTGQPNHIYLNVNGTLNPTADWSSDEADLTRDVEWADFDSDGNLDLAVANEKAPSDSMSVRLYLHDGDTLPQSASWSGGQYGRAFGLAWGDVDDDGDLDLAVANFGYSNRLYRNDGLDGDTPRLTLIWSSNDVNHSYDVAWGDVDGDGDLDLAVANYWGEPNKLYRNEGGALTADPVWQSAEGDSTKGIAWGDVDGDGDLDLASANEGQPSRVHRNDGGVLLPVAAWSSDETDSGTDAAWGDVDGDGDLDLAVSSAYYKRLYVNGRDGRSLPGAVPLVSVRRPGANADSYSLSEIHAEREVPISYTLFNPTGYTVPAIRTYYSINGGGEWLPTVAAGETVTTDLAASYSYGDSNDPDGPVFDWIDISATGTLIPVGDERVAGPYPIGFAFPYYDGAVTQFWVGDNGWLSLSPHVSDTLSTWYNYGLPNESAPVGVVAPFWDDLDPDAGGEVRYQTIGSDTLVLSYLGVPFYDGTVTGTGALTFQVILHQDGSISFQYNSLDPGAQSLGFATVGLQNATQDLGLQIAYNDPYVANGLAVHIVPRTDHTYYWDPAASGLFGQSDNVVFRIEAVPAIENRRNSVPGPYLRGAYAAQTFPFRVRGTQVRVMSDTLPVADAMVYRLPAGESLDGLPLANLAGQPFRTDVHGYLQGRGEIRPGDQLLALLPISATESYTLYLTGGTPTPLGVDAFSVSSAGVQTLTVSADHPLVLFNLDVSLEWDAHNDPTYLDQLAFNLQRASDYLYDFSDGQAALGHVNVFQNADNWAYSHVIVRATNRLRPLAAQGGIVLSSTIDPDHNVEPDLIVYDPGQVHMGATWNRYGNPGQSLGEDWPIILAHELSHYLFFHDDVYIGLNEDGLLIPIDTCTGSAMGDLYNDPNNTEFIADDAHWQANCFQTLANQTLGRNEWQTMQTWYPNLISPTNVMSGPALMPYDFTSIRPWDPMTPTNALADPTFYLDYDQMLVSSSEARAFLFRNGDAFPDDFEYIVDLGSPVGGQNRVVARGAQPGDRLCVFDRPLSHFGCEVIELGDDQLALEHDPNWNPVVQVSPVNSTTLIVEVRSAPAELTLYARLFPEFGPAAAPILLNPVDGVYSNMLILAEPSMLGHIQIWVDETDTEPNPRREAIVAYAIGGNPGYLRAGGGYLRAGGGYLRAGGGYLRAGGGYLRAGGAPIVSPDGQMIFFTEDPTIFDVGEFYTIQSMAGLPELPPGRTVIGQGYSLVATPGTPVAAGSVSIQYLTDDILTAGVDENGLSIYFYDGLDWSELDTVRSPYFNLVTAPSQGPGVYALMASVQVPLYAPGWNLFAYPIQNTQTVTDALLSISGLYTTVYGYDALLPQPWRLFQVDAPPYVLSLHHLEFGRGYWISATQAVTIHLSAGYADAAFEGASMPPAPPDTFYGRVLSSDAFTPTVGMHVQATIDGHTCGLGSVLDDAGQTVYVVHVNADDAATYAGCGQPGRTVLFSVDGQIMSPTAPWDSSQVNHLDLAPKGQIDVFLPVVLRMHP